jgi:Tfp pilus assembly protein PilO
MATGTNRREQLTTLLDKFYHNPVAMVSSELFLSIAAIIFFAVFAIRPTLLTMSDLIKEIEDKRKLDTQLTQKAAALATAQENFNAVEDRAYLLSQAIPEGVDLGYTLKVIEKAASDQDLTISNMTVLDIPQTIPENTPLKNLERRSMPIQAAVIGDYESIRQFIEQLRGSRRSYIVERITFAIENSRGQKTLEATILIGAPYFGLTE